MQVWAQFIFVDVDKNGSMFDFNAYFFIPKNSYGPLRAFYGFDKVSKPEKSNQLDSIEGADDPTFNESKRFRFDQLTGKDRVRAAAEVKLESSDADGFTINVGLKDKKDHSVSVTYKGKPPSWLGKNIFDGTLSLIEIKE